MSEPDGLFDLAEPEKQPEFLPTKPADHLRYAKPTTKHGSTAWEDREDETWIDKL